VADEERIDVASAGTSALRRAEALRRKRESIESERGPVGRLLASLFPSAAEVRLRDEEHHWETGGQGERTLAATLARRCPDVPMLHDRRAPMSRANIDHIAVAASGVWVIDCKRYRGKIEVVSPLFGKQQLRISGRDRTTLVDGLQKQVAHVTAALADLDTDVSVHGCLCFVAPEGRFADVGLPMLRTMKIKDYPLYYPRRLAKRLNRPGPLARQDARRLRDELAGRLPAAALAAMPAD
jgi:hypothetical protein